MFTICTWAMFIYFHSKVENQQIAFQQYECGGHERKLFLATMNWMQMLCTLHYPTSRFLSGQRWAEKQGSNSINSNQYLMNIPVNLSKS